MRRGTRIGPSVGSSPDTKRSHIRDRQPRPSHAQTKGAVQTPLTVDPDVRGLGIGRSLIDASTRLARALDCDVLVVGTKPDNHAAQAVYAACGFEAPPGDGSHFWKKVALPQDADVQNSRMPLKNPAPISPEV
nr:GNAT family N-acetyltransferase [Rubellimicrobium mesophilum]